MAYVLGCDIGSQSAKAVLVDSDGAVVGSASSKYDMIHLHDGWADQDPAEYRRALIESIRRVVAESGVNGREITHIGLSSQVDGVVPIDDKAQALRNAIIWLDRRAVAQTHRLAEHVDENALFALTGLNLDASHTAPKLMWLAENEPETYRQASSLPSVGGYVVAWLTGRSIQDHANSSSTLLYDVRARDWSDTLIDAAGLDRAKLPEIGAAHEPAATLRPEIAEELGLSATCIVVVSTGDDHAACLGAGGIAPGIVIDIVGTAEPVGVASAEPLFDSTRLVETHAHAVDGMYLIENPGFVSGGNTLWLSKNILGITQSELFDLAKKSVPGARGVRFIPALSGAMAPRWNDMVRGSFTGLGMNHSAQDMARAVVEANAFAFRDIYDRIDALGLAQTVRVVGGGSRSDLWVQTKATLCDVSMSRVTSDETSAVGAAVLAGLAAGIFRDVLDATDRVVDIHPEVVTPHPADQDALEDAYQEYRILYDALEPVYERGNIAS
jgi:xylulokinase